MTRVDLGQLFFFLGFICLFNVYEYTETAQTDVSYHVVAGN